MSLKLKELAAGIGGEVIGDGEILIDSAAPIESAGDGQITFVANPKYEKYLITTTAAAVVLPLDSEFNRLPAIKHKDPYFAFAQILDLLYPDDDNQPREVDPRAAVSENAQLGENCLVGPLSYIGDQSTIADNCTIYPQVFIDNDVTLGTNCRIYPGVQILKGSRLGNNVIIHSGTVIGSDGFGYARHESGIKKVQQIGWVEIGNDVEIGSNVSVDRGALGPTIIGNFVKIDNLVQIAHNVQIGDYSIIVAQVGISGSTRLGKGVILAGQVGVVGHIDIGDGVQVGAQSGVSGSIPDGKIFFGSPAREIMRAKRIEACVAKLPELFKRVRVIEKEKK